MDTLEEIKEKLNKEESIPKENKELALRIVEFFYKENNLIKFKYLGKNISSFYINITSLSYFDAKLHERKEPVIHFKGEYNNNPSQFKLHLNYSNYQDLVKEVGKNLKFYRLVPEKIFKEIKKSNTPLINLDLED